MKADEDTGKELEIQQLTPRADWKTCEHRRPPDGKRGAIVGKAAAQTGEPP